jgi:pantothenate kinase
MKINVNVAGFEDQFDISEEKYRPVLDLLAAMEESGRRKIAFLAGPPGSGKSTVAAIIQAIFKKPITVLPMDGFHFPNAYLKTHSVERNGETILLAQIKGAPESFDLARLASSLERLRSGQPLSWPIYDRTLHDVVPDKIPLPSEGLFIVEGNYLLLDEPGWRDLLPFADKTLFLFEPEEVLVDRLIARHIRGGKSPDHAREWVLRTDALNIRRVLTHRTQSNMYL